MTTARLLADAHHVHTMLVERSRAGAAPVTYGEVAARVGRIANGLGPLLNEVENLCARRGEPNLAVLVVNQSSGEPTEYAHRCDYWRAEQQHCLHYWAGPLRS
jgi:hypothetical protein